VWQLCHPSCVECHSKDGSPTSHSHSESSWLVRAKFYTRQELFSSSQWPHLTYRRTICPLPCATADGEAVAHPVCPMHIAHVMVRIHHNRLFYCIPLVIAEITFYWCTMNIHQHLNVSLIPPSVFPSYHRFSFIFLGFEAYPSCLVWQSHISFFSLCQVTVGHGGREMVHLQFLTTSIHFLNQFCHRHA
jgi:hypothetical protein